MLPEIPTTETAIAILAETVPVEGTPVEAYLRLNRLPRPPCLRCHPSLAHPEGGKWPVMVAPITDGDGNLTAVHMTFIISSEPRKAPVFRPTMVIGPAEGHAVRLAPPEAGSIVIGVNLEVCLSAMAVGGKPVWATLTLEGLDALKLPPEVRDVTILSATEEFSLRSAHAFRERCTQECRSARVLTLLPADFEYYVYPEDDFPTDF